MNLYINLCGHRYYDQFDFVSWLNEGNEYGKANA